MRDTLLAMDPDDQDVAARVAGEVIGELMTLPRDDWPKIHAMAESTGTAVRHRFGRFDVQLARLEGRVFHGERHFRSASPPERTRSIVSLAEPIDRA